MMDTQKKQAVYDYLDELRESGGTNMWAAARWLRNEFGFDKEEAREWLSAWMRDFDEK